MYEILKVLDARQHTPTRVMITTLSKCCHCGVVRQIALQNVNRANRLQRKHCPTCVPERYHNMTGTRIWRIWYGMLKRATVKHDRGYPRYGGSGRGVCEDWRNFRTFYRDMSPTYADGLTLERIDNSRGYSKSNCRWATNAEQQANKMNNRTLVFQGQIM